MESIERIVPIERVFPEKKDLDSFIDRYYEGVLKSVKDLNGNSKDVHYSDGKLEFTLNNEGEASVYMAPKSSWFDASQKIEEISEVNPKLGRKVAEEFYKKYSLGKDPYINDLLINDSTYTFRAPFLANLHTTDTLSKNGISCHFLLEGGFKMEDDLRLPIGARSSNPFEVREVIKSGRKRHHYQSLVKEVGESLDTGIQDFEEASQLQKSLEDYADVMLTRKGNKLTVYGNQPKDGDFDTYEKYGTLSLLEIGQGTAVVTQDPQAALDKISDMKKAYRKSRSECQTDERSHLLKNLEKIEDAIKDKRYVTPAQFEVIKQIPKENEKLVEKTLEWQIENYMSKVPLEKKKQLGFERSYIPKKDLEKAVEFYKGLEDSLVESGLGGQILLERASKNVEKRADKELKQRVERTHRAYGNHTMAKIAAAGTIIGLGTSIGGFEYMINMHKNSDPHKTDSSGLGIDDFNAIHTYGLDPHNQTAIKEFLAKIPNVTANLWNPRDPGMNTNDWVNYSLTDPLIKYLAERSEIVHSVKGNAYSFLVDGKPAWNSGQKAANGIEQPAFFFTHGRNGVCIDSAMADAAILQDMGYKAITVFGTSPPNATGHEWTEAFIKGTVYVVNFNDITPRDGFYESHGWTIDSNSGYDSNWYTK